VHKRAESLAGGYLATRYEGRTDKCKEAKVSDESSSAIWCFFRRSHYHIRSSSPRVYLIFFKPSSAVRESEEAYNRLDARSVTSRFLKIYTRRSSNIFVPFIEEAANVAPLLMHRSSG